VTVVATVFRRTEFLAAALESALAQTRSPREIIVTDDSNSSSIREICESMNRPDKIRYRSNPATLGAPLNIRAAIHEARGCYIAILNDDDAWEPSFLARVVQPLEQSDQRVLAFSDHWIMQADGTLDIAASERNSRDYGRAKLCEGEMPDPVGLVLKQNGVPLAMASIFRKDAFDLNLLVAEVAGAYDFWISCLLAATGRPFYYVKDRLTRYRLHPGMETGKMAADKSLNTALLFEMLLAADYFPSERNYLCRRLSGWFFQCAKESFYFDKVAQARKYLIRSLRLFPEWRAIIGLLISCAPRAARRRVLGFSRPTFVAE
ncbi:MAG TPA: glycosyltransferase, partial [Pyrinomonadaceae bacterium]|nr:glycosyltransferase [Pyrinomonadaceae bacterium]